MLTVGNVVVNESGLDEAAAPVAGWLETAPRPVQKMATYSPRITGRPKAPVGAASWAVGAISTAPWPEPALFSEKMPGANGATVAVCWVEIWPPTVAVTGTCVSPTDSHGICRFA